MGLQHESAQRGSRAAWWLRWLMGLAWVLLMTWGIVDAPGLDMDEAWYILAARGERELSDPLSGMTRYTGLFPVWLMELAPRQHAWVLLRLTSIACNGLALVVLSCWLRRRYPSAVTDGWALPFVATIPIWWIYSRNGVDYAMFGPVLSLLALYGLARGGRLFTFGAGVAWGLAAYNHVLASFVPASIGLAWLLVHRRLPRLAWRELVLGLALGAAPRVVALVLYRQRGITGTAAGYSFRAALKDLPHLPRVLFGILSGDTMYLRLVGHVVLPVVPYWLCALAFFVPWLRQRRAIPKGVQVALLSGPILAVVTAVFGLRLATQYMIYPSIALAFGLAELGAAAIAEDARSARLVRGAAYAMIGCNLLYLGANFYLPWQRGDLAVARFKLGRRNPAESNYAFLPKDALVTELRKLRPEQVLAWPSLERPLRVLLADDAIEVRVADRADPALRTVLVAYREGPLRAERCEKAGKRELCFRDPVAVHGEYLVYRHALPAKTSTR